MSNVIKVGTKNIENALYNVDCEICTWIDELKSGSPFLIKELETGYAVLSKYQYYNGYTLFLFKEHITELHHLEPEKRGRFLHEMSAVAEAVYKAVKPVKLNYELLGNSQPHLHWHIIPRFADDGDIKRPVWFVDQSIRESKSTYLSPEKRERLRSRILEHLKP